MMQSRRKVVIQGQLGQNDEQTSTQVMQVWDLPRLYNFLQSLKYGPVQRARSSITFENRNLIDIGKSILCTLNQVQTFYHKYYVGAICVFVCIINLPRHSKLVSFLKNSFFCSLAPILADILQFWSLHKQTSKTEAARAKIIAMLKSLNEIASKKTSFLPRVYNPDVMAILSNFELPNDQSIIKLVSKVVFQKPKHNNQHDKKLALCLYQAMEHPLFPASILDRCISFIQEKLESRELACPSPNIIVENLKKKLQQNLKAKVALINCNRLVLFINAIQSLSSQPAWEVAELCQYCEIIGGGGSQQEKAEKTKILKSIATNIVFFEQLHRREEIDGILHFACAFCELEVMAVIVAKISSARLVKLVTGGLLSKIIATVRDRSHCSFDRSQGLRLLAYIANRMASLNLTLYWLTKKVFQTLNQLGAEQQNGPSILYNIPQVVIPDAQFSLQ